MREAGGGGTVRGVPGTVKRGSARRGRPRRLTPSPVGPSVPVVNGHSRIEPSAGILTAVRQWLAPVRTALGPEFVACYLTGSVLHSGFDARRSRVNVLVITRGLAVETLDRLADAIPAETKQPPHFETLFMVESQMRQSLDAFPIEWTEITETHLLIEGHDVLGGLQVPRDNLRLQCEHEMRMKLLRLRQAYLADRRTPKRLEPVLAGAASSFAALFRTLLRLRGETIPASTPHVIERVADLYRLDARGLLAAYLVRFAEKSFKDAEILDHYRRFLVEVDRLVQAIDSLHVA